MEIKRLNVRVPVAELGSEEAILRHAATKLQQDRKMSEPPTIRVLQHWVVDDSQIDEKNTLRVGLKYQELVPGETEWPPVPDLKAERIARGVYEGPELRSDPADRFRKHRNASVAWGHKRDDC